MNEPKKLLSIGGWDPCGAFGVPADIKTFSAHGLHGMGVLTVATAQNSTKWIGAEFLPVDFVESQLEAVLSDYGTDGVKTGFLGRVDLIKMIGAKLAYYDPPHVVIDPVLVNHAGRLMFGTEVVRAYQDELLPFADIITPNLDEARVLVENETGDAQTVARELQAMFDTADVIVTGCRQGDQVVDWWCNGEQTIGRKRPWIATNNISGSGDTFSAALVCGLAQGMLINEALNHADRFIEQSIRRAKDWHLGQGPGPVGNMVS